MIFWGKNELIQEKNGKEMNNRNVYLFYHKDTNTFDGCPVSAIQLQNLDVNAQLPMKDENNFRFLTYDEIDHKELMRFYVKECVDDKEIRKHLFNILRRTDFVCILLLKSSTN